MVRYAHEAKYVEKKMFEGAGTAKMRLILESNDEMYGKGRVFNHLYLNPGCEVGWHIHHGDLPNRWWEHFEDAELNRLMDTALEKTEDGFSSGTFDKVIDAVHQKGKTVIVVSCQLPYDAARFPEADAILLTYWGSTMQGLPAEGRSWSPNLPAGLLSCFGLCEAKGVLPVNIPALDKAYQPTDEILWTRGQSAAEGNDK